MNPLPQLLRPRLSSTLGTGQRERLASSSLAAVGCSVGQDSAAEFLTIRRWFAVAFSNSISVGWMSNILRRIALLSV